MKTPTWYFLVISSSLLACPANQCKAESSPFSTSAEKTGLASIDSPNEQIANFEKFSGIAGMLNEVEERRRTVVYTAYPGLATQGVVHGFVHVTDGSLAFARSDLVVRSDMPITIRRSYNSKRTADGDFGNGGWRLTIAEEIHPGTDAGTYRYIYGNNLGVALSGDGDLLLPIDQVTTDIADIKFKGNGSIRVILRTGVAKEFIRRGDKFVLKAVTDEIGNGQLFEYDEFGLSAIITNKKNRVDFSRNSEGHITEIHSSDGRSVKYIYSDVGLLRSVSDVRGEPWSYEYDQNFYLSNAMTPMGTSNLSFQHDDDGKVFKSSINGRNLTFRYGDYGTIVRDALGREIRFESDVTGLTTRIINWVGTVSTIETNKSGQPEILMRNHDIISRTHYIKAAQKSTPVTQTVRHARSGKNVVLRFDDRGRVISSQSNDPNGSYRIDKYEYGMTPKAVIFGDRTRIGFRSDSVGNPSQIQTLDGTTIDFKWSDSEAQVSIGDESATLQFDGSGQLTTLSIPGDKNIDYRYGQGGFRELITVSDGTEISYQYSPAGTLIYTETTQPNGKTETFVYDVGADEILKRISGSGVDGHHVFSYTSAGRLGSIDSTVMNSFTFLYDDRDRLEVAIPNGFEPITYEYDAGEADIVAQHDARSRAVYGQRWDNSEFSSRFDQLYSRTISSQIGTFTYNEQLGEFISSISPDTWLPSDIFTSAVSNTKFLSLFGQEEPDIFSFSMPSNRLFVPAEYWAVNCCFCCPISEIACEIP